MATGILVLQVDDTEVFALGVVGTLDQARELVKADATRYLEDNPTAAAEAAQAAMEAMDEALEAEGSDPFAPAYVATVDIRWESGVGSWDYELMSVEVQL